MTQSTTSPCRSPCSPADFGIAVKTVFFPNSTMFFPKSTMPHPQAQSWEKESPSKESRPPWEGSVA